MLGKSAWRIEVACAYRELDFGKESVQYNSLMFQGLQASGKGFITQKNQTQTDYYFILRN